MLYFYVYIYIYNCVGLRYGNRSKGEGVTKIYILERMHHFFFTLIHNTRITGDPHLSFGIEIGRTKQGGASEAANTTVQSAIVCN